MLCYHLELAIPITVLRSPRQVIRELMNSLGRWHRSAIRLGRNKRREGSTNVHSGGAGHTSFRDIFLSSPFEPSDSFLWPLRKLQQLRDVLEKLPAIEELLESARENVAEEASKSTQPTLKQYEQALSDPRNVLRKVCTKGG